MKKFSVISFQLPVLILFLCLGVSVANAQSAAPAPEKPPALADVARGLPPREGGGVKPPLQEPPAPVSMSMPEFLAKYDKFLTLGEARANAEKRRAEYEAAVKVLNEQIGELAAELRSQIPPGHVWDPAKRELVKVPEPAKPAEKEKEKP